MTKQINNQFYNDLGELWYTAFNHPIALLRAQSKLLTQWIFDTIQKENYSGGKILDIGCGAGFFTNAAALRKNFKVTGIDLSKESLEVARKFDLSQEVSYLLAEANTLPIPSQSMDVVVMLDFLEHIKDHDKVLSEVARVLKPGGLLFFHTFNRNWLSWLLVIKAVEWFVRNTPKRLHVLSLFLKPKELQKLCLNQNLQIEAFLGTRPVLFSKSTLELLRTRSIPREFSFRLTPSTKVGYCGYARKLISDKLA